MPSSSGATVANGANSGSRSQGGSGRPAEGGGEHEHATVRSRLLNGQRRGMAGSIGHGSALKRGLKRLSLHKAARNEEHDEVFNNGIAIYCDDISGNRKHAMLRVRE